MRVILVVGPWGSGTSATVQVLVKLGAISPGPHEFTTDPRTPNSYETAPLSRLLRSLVSEETLAMAPEQAVIDGLKGFRGNLEKAVGTLEGPVVLKHPLMATMLPQVCSVFDAGLVYVIRPSAAIEASRVRRHWAAWYGAAGASRIYRLMFEHLVESEVPVHLIRYDELLREPDREIRALAAFAGLSYSTGAAEGLRRAGQ